MLLPPRSARDSVAAKGHPVPLKPVAFQRITKAFYPYGDSAGRSTKNFEGARTRWVQTSTREDSQVTGRYRMTRRVKFVAPTGLYSKNLKPRGEESKAIACDTRGSPGGSPSQVERRFAPTPMGTPPSGRLADGSPS